MSKPDSFPLAAVPEPFRILGKRLKPFSIGHEILLQRFGVAFSVEHPGNPGFADLVMGVFICSRTFEQAVKDLQSPLLRCRLAVWGRACGKFDYLERIASFHKYISHNRDIPKLWPKPGSAKLKSPWIAIVRSALRIECGLSDSEIMNAPLWLSLRDIIAYREMTGRAEINDEIETANAIDHAKALLEDILAGKRPDITKGRS